MDRVCPACLAPGLDRSTSAARVDRCFSGQARDWRQRVTDTHFPSTVTSGGEEVSCRFATTVVGQHRKATFVLIWAGFPRRPPPIRGRYVVDT